MRKVRYWDGFSNQLGVFHEWGIGEYYRDGNYFSITMGIVESENGVIEMIKPEDIEFIKDEFNDETLERFKTGKIGIKVSTPEEYKFVVKLYEQLFPSGENFMTQSDIDEFSVLRVDGDSTLNGYYNDIGDDMFETLYFNKFKEELEK